MIKKNSGNFIPIQPLWREMKGDQTRVSPLYTCASSPVHSQQLTPCRSPPRFLFTRRLQVYRTLTIDELKRRLSCLSLPFSGVEKVILRAVRRHYLNVRIDYRFNCLRFETGNFEVERTQKQLTQLGSNLKKVADSLAGPERTAPTTASPKAALIANMRLPSSETILTILLGRCSLSA